MGTSGNLPSHQRFKSSYSQYVSLRQRLDDLGYNSFLSNDSVPLVDKLLNDLVRYKSLSNQKPCSTSTRKASQSSLPNDSNSTAFTQQNEIPSQACKQKILNERPTNIQSLEAINLENSRLQEQIADLKFVLDQNAAVIQKLKKDNDTKSLLILKLQNGSEKGESHHPKVSRANVEKDGELPAANLSKIQALYKRILSASDNPAIIDWVKAAETKISNLERELDNTRKALDVSQHMCEDYHRQVLEYENKVSKSCNNKEAQNYALMKSRMEQKERENRELQAQLSEAVRKQHEAMSRAIMLAGDRPQNREATVKSAIVEKKVVGLESERNMLKHMLTSTQKERDELMKEVHRLHSQENTLMNEIRTLVTETSAQGSKQKNVRFQNNKQSAPVDTAKPKENEDGAGGNRENWLKRLTEQRQLYYDNVHQLLNYMRNRQEFPPEQRPHSEASNYPSTSSDASTAFHTQHIDPAQPSQQHYYPEPYVQPLLNYQPPGQHPQSTYTAQVQPNHQFAQPAAQNVPQESVQPNSARSITPRSLSAQTTATQGVQVSSSSQATTQTSSTSSSEQPTHRAVSTTTNVSDRKTQTEKPATMAFTPSSEELGTLPRQFQVWAQAILEERKVLKEKNAALRLQLDEVTENSQESDVKVNHVADKLRKAEDMIARLRADLDLTNNKLQSTERDLLLEKTKLQQLQLDIQDADGNTASLTRKFMDKSGQLDAEKQLCNQLELKVSTLEDQNSSLQNQLRALQQNQRSNAAMQQLLEEVESRNARISQLEKQLSSKMDMISQRDSELEAVNSKLKATERELLLERTKLQQLQLDIDNADGNAAALTRKMVEKSAQLDVAKQRYGELELQVAKLEEQVGTMQGQLRGMQVHRAQGETEQRQILDELDACKARISQLDKQLTMKQETVNLLQTSVQTYETKIRVLEQEGGDKHSQVELNRRQNLRLTGELDQAKTDNAALRQENERLVAVLAQTRVDLERERQGAEDLRREIQSYVSHVRKVESILARKDEERDELLKQFQALANETSSFDAEREQMERTLRSHQQQTTTLQSELSGLRRKLGELEALYAHQRSAGAEAELQAGDLMRRLGLLERDLRDSREDKMRLEQQVAAANDLQHRLEKQMERLRTEAAQADSTTHQLETETTRLHEDMHILEQRMSKEKEAVRSLESLVSILRQERAQQENQLRSMSQDLTRLQHREIILQEELANMKAELCSTEGKVTDLTRENQRLKQEVLQEKFEREKNRQEFKRNLSHTPVPSFNVSPAPPGALHNMSAATISGSSLTGSGSPRKRVTVAARFANNETQT